jgi:putative DNA primase/helicase
MQAMIERDEVDVTDKKGPGYWKVALRKSYNDRTSRLRTESGVRKTLFWAPIVHEVMSVKESDFNQHPMLLPVKNGVIDLTTGTLTNGRQGDMLTMAIDVEYDPHADHADYDAFMDEITGDPEVSAFVWRSLGYAITGHSYEQFIWIFIGPGRNGKGVLFNLLSELMGPYYHEISRSMILEQRNEPSPGAASEHLYSLLGKRLIVGAETNKNQRVDGAAVKTLTGANEVKCRPNFRSEIIFFPTHSLFLQTNNMPTGMTKEFSLLQRLRIIEFPFMYVDDIAAEIKKNPGKADKFRQKDPLVFDRLRRNLQGLLARLVKGCREWQEIGLAPPASIINGIDMMAKAEDYLGQFYEQCLVYVPPDAQREQKGKMRIPLATVYNAFCWWWSENRDSRDNKLPAKSVLKTLLIERGFPVEFKGGANWLNHHYLAMDISENVTNYAASHEKL